MRVTPPAYDLARANHRLNSSVAMSFQRQSGNVVQYHTISYDIVWYLPGTIWHKCVHNCTCGTTWFNMQYMWTIRPMWISVWCSVMQLGTCVIHAFPHCCRLWYMWYTCDKCNVVQVWYMLSRLFSPLLQFVFSPAMIYRSCHWCLYDQMLRCMVCMVQYVNCV